MTYPNETPRYDYIAAVKLARLRYEAVCGGVGLKTFEVVRGGYWDNLGRFVLCVAGSCCGGGEFWARIEVSPEFGIVEERKLTLDEITKLVSDWLS